MADRESFIKALQRSVESQSRPSTHETRAVLAGFSKTVPAIRRAISDRNSIPGEKENATAALAALKKSIEDALKAARVELVDPYGNVAVAGFRYDMTADDVIEYCNE